jgi:hypothetical protein
MPAKKNSLVENINRRKRAGKSRPKARSTISASAYEEMQQGWPSKKRVKRKKKPAGARPQTVVRKKPPRAPPGGSST